MHHLPFLTTVFTVVPTGIIQAGGSVGYDHVSPRFCCNSFFITGIILKCPLRVVYVWRLTWARYLFCVGAKHNDATTHKDICNCANASMHRCIAVCIYMFYILTIHAAANICTCKNGKAAAGKLYVHARACALVCLRVCCRHRSSHPIPVQLELFGVLVRFHRIVSP